MAHHLRKENNCLNCGAIVQERFCSRCGQENLEPKESFGHVIRHFFEDFTHYDSKFLVTIKDLLFKPGFLTAEYLSGRRQSYLHPIRMYLFISFIYFLLLLSFNHAGGEFQERMMQKASYDDRKIIADSVGMMLMEARQDTTNGKITAPTLTHVLDLLHFPADSLHERFNPNVFGSLDYKFLVRYDSIQRALPADQRDRGIKPWAYGRWLHTMKTHGIATMSLVIQKIKNVIPKTMFLLLPLIALVLKLLYSRKKYRYADHAIFTLHFHSAMFLLFLFSLIVSLFVPSIKMYLNQVELLLLMVYFNIALRKVYQQSWWLTIVKSLVVIVLYLGFLAVGVVSMGVIALL